MADPLPDVMAVREQAHHKLPGRGSQINISHIQLII
jgi:hypothetical protein